MRKLPKQNRPRKKRSPVRRSRKNYRAPRTAKELFSRPRQFQKLWNRVVQVPAEMRAKKLNLRQASRVFSVNPKIVTQLAGRAFKKRADGRYLVKANDRLLRVLVIPSEKGLQEIVLKDSREASFIGEYWSAIERFISLGDSSALRRLRRKTVKDSSGKRVRLLTDMEKLKKQASFGNLKFEEMYGRSA